MYCYKTTPRAMNFGHSQLEPWNNGLEEYANSYAPSPLATPVAHHHHHSSELPPSNFPSQRPLHTTEPLQSTAYHSTSNWQPRFDPYDTSGASQSYPRDSSFVQPQAYPSHLSPQSNLHQSPSYSRLLPASRPLPANDHASQPRQSMAGSLDPSTGIFYGHGSTTQAPRLRTAQACEKCRIRKAKCSGEHPSCKRCLTRGLICEYAKEGRVRGPNKPKKPVQRSAGDEEEGSELSRSKQRSRSQGSPSSPAMGSAQASESTPTSLPLPLNTSQERLNTSMPYHSSFAADSNGRPQPPTLSLDTASSHLRPPSRDSLEGLSSTSSYSRTSGHQQYEATHYPYEYNDEDRRHYRYSGSPEGSASCPPSAVSLTFSHDGTPPPRVFQPSGAHHLHYHYDNAPHHYQPSPTRDYDQTGYSHSLPDSSSALVDG